MKRTIHIFIAIILTSLCVVGPASAQEDRTPVALAPTARHRVATNLFSQNWEVSAGINFSSWYSNEEKTLIGDRGFLKGYRTSFGWSAGVTKWFSPEIAIRVKLTGTKGKQVISEDAARNDIDYWNLQIQPMLNLSSIIWGYDHARRWEIKPYAGVGVLRNCTYSEYVSPATFGINVTRRVTDRVKVYGEIEYNMAINEMGRKGIWSDNLFSRHDHWTTFGVGLVFELGKNKWDRVPDMSAIQVVPWEETNRRLSDAGREIDRLNEENRDLRNRPEKIVERERIVNRHPDVSVFFEIGSHSLTRRGQLENVRKLVETAKKDRRMVQVIGYADSQTGDPAYNERLSAKRADTIVRELELMGLDRSQIRTVTGGGVDMLNPKPANRRVVVSLMK